MKIGITGVTGGLGKYLSENWSNRYEIIGASLRDGIKPVFTKLNNCDVFINHAYNNIDQSRLLKLFFDSWINKNKTIINFGTSNVYETNGVFPVYSSNKKHLYNLSKELCATNPNKSVRVINFNPGTLESNRSFEQYNKLKFSELSRILEFIINTPNHIEISDLCVKNTRREKRNLV